MKAIVFPYNYGRIAEEADLSTGENTKALDSREREKAWYIVADSAVSNTGKPFYIPDELGECAAHLAIVVRISRLGKGIPPKYGGRYFKEFAPAVLFSLPGLEKHLKEKGLPPDPALNFDKALMVGAFEDFNPHATANLRVNNGYGAELRLNDLIIPIEELIADFSRFNTIKMGDYLVPGISGDISLRQEDILQVDLDGLQSFSVRIK